MQDDVLQHPELCTFGTSIKPRIVFQFIRSKVTTGNGLSRTFPCEISLETRKQEDSVSKELLQSVSLRKSSVYPCAIVLICKPSNDVCCVINEARVCS
jgi:hypothetical protein